jgi:hypothetical protein
MQLLISLHLQGRTFRRGNPSRLSSEMKGRDQHGHDRSQADMQKDNGILEHDALCCQDVENKRNVYALDSEKLVTGRGLRE